MQRSIFLAAPMLLCFAGAFAGGSNYGIAPGAKQLSGKISEWPVPTPKFARDPAPGPDGNIYITVMQGDRIARFDIRTGCWSTRKARSGTRETGTGPSASSIRSPARSSNTARLPEAVRIRW